MHLPALSALTAAALLAPPALAHWNFESLLINGQDTEPYQYVRRTKNSNGPIVDVSSPDMICNAGGIDPDVMSSTSTAAVTAGDTLGFRIRDSAGHPGPMMVYMSRAPDGIPLQEYQGGGEWFKIYEMTSANLTADPITWAMFPDSSAGISSFTFKLPAELPAGQYLLRAEGLALHGAGEVGGAQFYIGCAQIDVASSGGGSGGSPSPTIAFPGGYDAEDPGILVNLYWPPLRAYDAPGPRPWPSGCSDHTANLVGEESDGDCTPLEDSAKGG